MLLTKHWLFYCLQQIQQVDGNELDQNNIEEIGTDSQEQLVYVGQPGDSDYQQQTVTGDQQQLHYQHQELLQNGQYLTGTDQVLEQQQLQYGNSVYASEEQVLQQHINTSGMEVVAGDTYTTSMESGAYGTMESNYSTNTTSSLSGSRQASVAGAQHLINGGLHTTSLNNGVVLSYAATDVAQGGQEANFSSTNGILPINSSSINGHVGLDQKALYNGSKLSSSTQYTDPSGDNSNYVQTIPSRTTHNRGTALKHLGNRKTVSATHTVVDDIVRIQIDTGYNDVQKEDNLPPDVIRISTTTGQLKTRAPKFFRCTSCNMHFASENALVQHIKHGCNGSRKRTSYECTYCSSKFASKARTMEHLKVCSMRWQAKCKSKGSMQGNMTGRVVSRKPTTQTVEVEINSDEEEETAYRQEKSIVYDDDDDVDVDLAADNEDYESNLLKVTQKHLGPMLTGGKFQCRDCDRTFNKDAQYKRHVGACTNAPLNSSRIDDTDVSDKKPLVEKKPRGRPRKFPLEPSKIAESIKSKPVPLDKVRSAPKPVAECKEDLSDLDWDFLSTPKKERTSDSHSSKKANHIMAMLKENMGEGNLDDGSKELSESFLQCLDENAGVESKGSSPTKPQVTVCGLCVRHMDTPEQLCAHVSSVHAKDVVNMHAILSNNTDLETYKCPLCQLHYVSVEGVKEHIVAIHLDSLQDTLKSLRINSQELPCPWCSQKSMSKELFQQHLASQHSHEFPETALQPSIKPEELDAKSLRAGSAAAAAEAELLSGHICLSCGTTFTKWNKLEQHMATCSKDTSVGKHPCNYPECVVKSFDSLADLVSHIEEVNKWCNNFFCVGLNNRFCL